MGSVNYPHITVKEDGQALIARSNLPPKSGLAELSRLRSVTVVRFEKEVVKDVDVIAKELYDLAISQIGSWTKFWDSLGSLLFSCFGYKTTLEKVDVVFKSKQKKDYKIADEEEKGSPKRDDSPLKDESKDKEKSPQSETNSSKKEGSPNHASPNRDKPLTSDEQKAKDEANLKAEEEKRAEEARVKAESHAALKRFAKEFVDSRLPSLELLTDAFIQDLEKAIDSIDEEEKKVACLDYIASLNIFALAIHFAKKSPHLDTLKREFGLYENDEVKVFLDAVPTLSECLNRWKFDEAEELISKIANKDEVQVLTFVLNTKKFKALIDRSEYAQAELILNDIRFVDIRFLGKSLIEKKINEDKEYDEIIKARKAGIEADERLAKEAADKAEADRIEAEKAAIAAAEIQKKVNEVKSRFERVLTLNALNDISNDLRKIRTIIGEIDNELNKCDETVKQDVYKYLASLDHYQLAKYYAGLAHVTVEDISDKIQEINSNIKNANFLEAERLIDTLRFVDQKAILNVKIELAKQAIKDKEEADIAARAEAEKKAIAEKERIAKEAAENQAKLDAEKKAKAEADRIDAENKAKTDAEKIAKDEAERKAKAEADQKAKEEQERLKKEADAKKAEAARLADLERKQKCTDDFRTASKKLNPLLTDEAKALAYVETLKNPKVRDACYEMLISSTYSYKNAKEYASRITDKSMQSRVRKERGLLAKEDSNRRFASSSLKGKLSELERDSNFDASLHLILSQEYVRECIQKQDWLGAFETINHNIHYVDLKHPLIDELNKLPHDKKIESIQKLDVNSFNHDENMNEFLNQIKESDLKEIAALLFLPKFKKRTEAIKAVNCIQDPKRQALIRFENGLFNEAELAEFFKGKTADEIKDFEKVNPYKVQSKLIAEINGLIDENRFDEAEKKFSGIRFDDLKAELNNKIYNKKKGIASEFDGYVHSNVDVAIHILKEQKGDFQNILVKKFFDKVESTEKRLEALPFIRDENLKKDIRINYSVYTLAEWDAVLSQVDGVESELTNSNYDKAREIIKNTNYSDSTKNALFEAIKRREKSKSKWGLFGY